MAVKCARDSHSKLGVMPLCTIITCYFFPTGNQLHIFCKDLKAKHMPAEVKNVTYKFSATRLHKSLITQCSLSHVGMRKRFIAHHHFTFLKHVLWIILSSHLSLFVSIIQTQTTKSKSLWLWPKRNGTLIKLHFVLTYDGFQCSLQLIGLKGHD